MPDIAKCIGSGCSVKDKCYRFTSKPSGERQSWFLGVPGSDELCDWYMETIGPQKQPSSVSQIEAATKQAKRELDEKEKQDV